MSGELLNKINLLCYKIKYLSEKADESNLDINILKEDLYKLNSKLDQIILNYCEKNTNAKNVGSGIEFYVCYRP